MNVKSAEFKFSSQKISQIPADGLPEFAFIGRSNVGKSSLINMLTGRTSLAKVSSTPGKTQLINHFLINDGWYMVDLPGYGYAKVSKGRREKFAKLVTDYILKHEKLFFLFILVDSRLEPQKIDLEFIGMLGENGIPFGIVFTKSDKQSPARTAHNIEQFEKALSGEWEQMPPIFVTSSEKKIGGEEILGFIGSCISGDYGKESV